MTPALSITDWIARDAIPFTPEIPDSFNPAVDRLLVSLDPSVQLLALGEPLHGGADFLLLRNRLFQRLVEAHGYTAIALESSYPRGFLVDDYVAGRGPATCYDDVQFTGFSHNFGPADANRQLVEWMRQYNATHDAQLQFYGFDAPTEMTGADSPRQLLHFTLDYLASTDDPAMVQPRRQRIDDLLGDEAAWSNSAATFDPAQSIGLSPAATALRIETEDLLTDLRLRRPELTAKSDAAHHADALHAAASARSLLTYHAGLARPSPNRIAELLGLRDVMMADNLAHLCARERGKVLAFAHNSHLQRNPAQWQFGPQLLVWWPAGAQLHEMLGPRYAVIGAALGRSDPNGVPAPDPGSLEQLLTASPGPARFIPTHRGQSLPAAAIAALPPRTTPWKNPSYFPLTPQHIAAFDAFVALDASA